MTTDALVYLTEATGELVAPDRPAADLTVDVLAVYGAQRSSLDLARSDLAARIEQLVADDKAAWAMRETVRSLELATGAVEEALADVFSPALRLQHGRGISLDVGTVRVTWPKPSERWTQRVKPEAIAARDPELAAELGIERKQDKPRAPVITVRAPETVTVDA